MILERLLGFFNHLPFSLCVDIDKIATAPKRILEVPFLNNEINSDPVTSMTNINSCNDKNKKRNNSQRCLHHEELGYIRELKII